MDLIFNIMDALSKSNVLSQLFSWIDEAGDSDLMGSECPQVLYVVEKVQLELGMQLDKEEESPYACPIHLHKDSTSPAR